MTILIHIFLFEQFDIFESLPPVIFVLQKIPFVQNARKISWYQSLPVFGSLY